jgi:hypothetical protein
LVDGHRVTINTLDNQPLRIDGQVTTITPGDSVSIGAGQISFNSGVYTIVYPNQERLLVSDHGNYIDLRFCALDDRADGTLRGLLGNFDGNATNDLTTRDGTVLSTQPTFDQFYNSYADSWRINQAESLFDYRPGESTETFTSQNCPIQKTTLASLPPELVAQAIALLDAAGITDSALREAAILDYAMSGGDPSFITSAGQIEAPTQVSALIDPTIIWTNGGEVIIGSAATPSQFNIGTNAPAPTGVTWTGVALSDNWSEAGNWSPAPPLVTDNVIFTGVGASGINRVDQDFTIAALHYTGGLAPVTSAADHIMDLADGSTLTVSGNATLGVTNPDHRVSLIVSAGTTVTANVTNMTVGGSGNGNSTGMFTLADNTTLNVGTAAAPANLNIGWFAGGGGTGGSATGVFDALVSEATLNLHLNELNVGLGRNAAATGTLKWNQTEAIDATSVTFGRGNATGNLEVPTDGTFLLGTAADRVTTLRVADNDFAGTASATLDFSITNPTFAAYVGGELTVGRSLNGAANGILKLGSNSTLDVGTAAAPTNLNIGWFAGGGGTGGSATGVFDAFDGALTAHLNELNAGRTTGLGTASGGLILGNDSDITATTANVGVGIGASGNIEVNGGNFHATTVNQQVGSFDFSGQTLNIGNTGSLAVQTFNLKDGLLTGDIINLSGGAFNFTGGTLAVDTFNGSLNQVGGSLAPGGSPGTTTINGNYSLASAGALDIELSGLSPGAGYDQLEVNGLVNLNSNNGTGGLLDVILGFAPSLGQSFTLIENDGADAIAGQFAGLSEGASFNEVFAGFQYTFDISYLDGDGNDVGVTLIGVAPV